MFFFTFNVAKSKLRPDFFLVLSDFMDFHQNCLKFHQGGLSQVTQNVLLPPIHTWHFDTDFTDFHKKFQRELKLTCGCCLWHDLHGLRIKVIKISQGWSFISNKENIFSGDTYVAFGHGLHGLTEKVSKKDKKNNLWSPLLARTSRT